jgi:hypothetical protein
LGGEGRRTDYKVRETLSQVTKRKIFSQNHKYYFTLFSPILVISLKTVFMLTSNGFIKVV